MLYWAESEVVTSNNFCKNKGQMSVYDYRIRDEKMLFGSALLGNLAQNNRIWLHIQSLHRRKWLHMDARVFFHHKHLSFYCMR